MLILHGAGLQIPLNGERGGKRRKGKNGENVGENDDGIYVGMNVLRGVELKNGKMCNN